MKKMQGGIYKYVPDAAMADLIEYIGSMCLSDAGMSVGTSTEAVDTASAANYLIQGIHYSLSSATSTTIAVVSGDEVIADGKKAFLAVLVDSSGDTGSLMSPVVDNVDTINCTIPEWDPETYSCIGGVLVQNESGSDFTVGTTGLDTSGITDTYYDFGLAIPFMEIANP